MQRPRLILTLALALAGGCKSAPGAADPTATPAPVQKVAPQETKETIQGTASAAPAKPLAPVATVEGVTEYQLENGLRVLLYPDASRDTFTVNVTYLVGSRHEGYGETGMAHLLEHMLFKGTPRYPEFDKILKPRGAVNNASTSYDRTNYFEILPATDANLEIALDLEADRMLNAKIAAEDLAKEFSVVRNEFEKDENDPGNVLSERVLSTAYLWHNYGKSTIGSRADIERVPADALKQFYAKYYQPDNAVLIVGGKIDKDKTLALVQKYFAPLPRPTRKLAPTYTVEPQQDGERLVTLRRTGDVQVVEIVYHTVASADERYPALRAIGYLLSDKPTGRLYKAIVEKGLATSVGAFNDNRYDPGVFTVFAEVPVGKPIEPVRDKIFQIVEGLGKDKPTDEEINRFKAAASKQFELAVTNAQAVTFGLSEATAQGDWRLMYLQRDRAEKVAPAAAADVAATFFKPQNRTVGLFVPTKEPARAPLTERPDAMAMVKGYTGRAAGAEGEAFEATVDNIEKRTTRKELPGGMKLAFLSKETKGDVVIAQLSLHFGTEKELQPLDQASSFVGPMLMRGTKKHTFEQLKSELDRLKAQVNVSSGSGDATVSIRTVRKNLPEVLALVSEIVRQPAWPKEELETMRKEALTDTEQSLSDPVAQGSLALQRRTHPYPKTDIRYVPTTKEELERIRAVSIEDVKKVHAMWGASHSEMTVIGDFDPAEIEAAIQKGFGDWKNKGAYARIADPYKEVAAASDTIDTPDKENTFIGLVHVVPMRDDNPDYAATWISAFVLGNGFQSRLVDRLRTKEGWSYAANAGFGADALDERGTLQAFAFVAPQNSAKALAATVEEIDRLVKDGIPKDELDRAKAAYKGQFARALSSDESILGMINRGLYLGRTLAWNAKVADAIAALTPESVAAVLKKGTFDAKSMVRVTAGDLKKAAPAQ